ncbi:MAG: amino acid permease, partial [Mycoplasmataceae bacterium]|nr:amino acid permease [Mycoplasmataceae bacterium]
MEPHKARKIGFFSALSICFSSVVGIGIFLKNASVGKNVEGDGVSWLITWIICGLLAILLAFHFGKIAQVESNQKLTGLSAWTSGIVDKKNNWFKKIVFTNYGFFYIPILLVTLSFFTIEFFFEFLKTINPNIKLD